MLELKRVFLGNKNLNKVLRSHTQTMTPKYSSYSVTSLLGLIFFFPFLLYQVKRQNYSNQHRTENKHSRQRVRLEELNT